MTEKIFLEELTQDKVNTVKKQYTTIDGTEYQIGEPHRCAYENSSAGRSNILQDIPDPYYSAVMLIWGNTPTITLE